MDTIVASANRGKKAGESAMVQFCLLLFTCNPRSSAVPLAVSKPCHGGTGRKDQSPSSHFIFQWDKAFLSLDSFCCRNNFERWSIKDSSYLTPSLTSSQETAGGRGLWHKPSIFCMCNYFKAIFCIICMQKEYIKKTAFIPKKA